MARTIRRKPLLTATMTKVLARHASGLTLQDVAKELYLSYSAVTNNMYQARKRLGVSTMAGLVARAHALGYLTTATGPDLAVFPTQPSDLQDRHRSGT
jgi:DNA-binding NarL/FixJ family response regulator